MPRAAKPADIAKVVKAIQAVDEAWRDANARAQDERYCNAKPKPGTPIVKTLLRCQSASETNWFFYRQLQKSIALLDKAMKALPPSHPWRIAGEAVAAMAFASNGSLERRQDTLRKREKKLIEKLKRVKHK